MVRIAHITDIHLVEQRHMYRRGADLFRLRFLTFGRVIDVEKRKRRLRAAVELAQRAGADWFAFTGDLTEDGEPAQFEVLAEVLGDSGVDPQRCSLIWGNHDSYTEATAFRRAMAGPLAGFSKTSRLLQVYGLDDCWFIPVSTVMLQPFVRSAGYVSSETLQELYRLGHSLRRSGRPIVVGLHHGPVPHTLTVHNWVDGLVNAESLLSLMRIHRHMHVIHGHNHRAMSWSVDVGERPRVFEADAIVDGERSLRVYEVDGRITPVGDEALFGSDFCANDLANRMKRGQNPRNQSRKELESVISWA